jgi:hypothetical protein
LFGQLIRISAISGTASSAAAPIAWIVCCSARLCVPANASTIAVRTAA